MRTIFEVESISRNEFKNWLVGSFRYQADEQANAKEREIECKRRCKTS